MNLWVRTLRQLTVLAVALFFFSCEDETSILGFKNPNKKFQVAFIDIPLDTSTVLAVDSIITDLRPLIINGQTSVVDGILVGEYQDPDFGKINAQSFLAIYPTVNNALAASAVYDSVTVQFRLNFYGYGFTGNQDRRFAIHEMTGDTLTFFGGNRYYSNSPAPQMGDTPLGEAVVSVNADSLQKQAALTTGQDTLFARARLADEYGQKLFAAIKPGLTDQSQQRLFKAQIKGLALIPSGEPGILGMNVVNNFGQLSRVILHYHTLDANGAVDDTLSRTFGFDYTSFTKVQPERTGTELAAMQPYESIAPLSNKRYIQSGAAILTKLNLAPFYEFADTVDNLIINSAELIIDNVEAPAGHRPHNSLMLRLMNNDADQFLNSRVAADRDILINSRYFVLQTENYYTASTDTSTPVTIGYDAENKRYSGFMTLFAQSLFMNKDDGDGINSKRIRHLALYPFNPSAQRSVTRTVFNKEDVKLRIYYTRANPVTP